MPVPDSLTIGRWADGSILVVRYDISRFPLVERARRRIVASGAPILKTVFNEVRSSHSHYGYGYGNYGYGARSERPAASSTTAAE